MRAVVKKHTFNFIKPAGTSRGVLYTKDSWFLTLFNEDDSISGTGECSVIKGLSPDFVDEISYEKKLNEVLEKLKGWSLSDFFSKLKVDSFTPNGNAFLGDLDSWPSLRFGLECALFDLNNKGCGIIFHNAFSRGESSIPINGLVWMGTKEFMLEQIDQKLAAGFKTIKLKIGAIDFNTELGLIKGIRQKYSADDITIRVDANGAFDERSVYMVLKELQRYKVHSIEQPVSPIKLSLLRELAKENIVPIALDESLINQPLSSDKSALLEEISPQYIVLKPSLHGGISGTAEWIRLADKQAIAWWITSALEGSIGLAAIAQFTANYPIILPQGLGTGGIFSNNLPSNLVVTKGSLTMTL